MSFRKFFSVLARFSLRYEKIIFLVLLISGAALLVSLSLLSVAQDTATDDEPAHIVAGYIKLKHGYFDFYPEQPPLINTLSALPLLFQNLRLDPIWETNKNHWSVGHEFLYRSGNDAAQILLLSRIPIVVLFLLLCLVLAWCTYRHTRSRSIALLVFYMAALCPNLMAHGRLATVDMGVTLFMLLAVLCYAEFLQRPRLTSASLTGLFIAGACLSKVSALILFPYCALAGIFFLTWTKRWHWKYLKDYLLGGLVIFGVIFIVYELLYGLLISPEYLSSFYPDAVNNFLFRLGVPFQEYWKNIQAVYRWVSQDYDKPQFLWGQFSFSGWWYYYPITFILKSSIPTVLLFLLSLLFFLNESISFIRKKASAAARTIFPFAALIVLFIVLFLVVSSSSRIDLGVRYILPVYPFIYIFIGISLWCFGRSKLSKRIPVWLKTLFFALLIGSILFSNLRSFPGYLGYFNEFIPQRDADRYLIDSNLDWGQDLRRLADWVDQNRLERIHVDYFGGGDVEYYLGKKAIPWQSTRELEPGYYAVSRHFFRTSDYFDDKGGQGYEKYLQNAEFVALIGTSIYIYYVPS